MHTPAEILAIVEKAGAKWNGIQHGLAPGQELALFTDLVTCSTICLPLADMTPEKVTRAIAAKRAEYGEKGDS